MKNINSVSQIVEDSAKMVCLRLNRGWDYVWVTYHEAKGFISITSSFGNYSYIWSAMGEGQTLSTFFKKAHPEYLARKMFNESRQEKHSFECGRAIVDAKKYLFQELREGNTDSSDAREAYNALVAFEDEYGSDLSRDMFIDRFMNDDVLNEWLPEVYEHSFGQELSGSYRVFENEVVPLIQKYFKGELKAEESDEVSRA